MLTAVGVDEDGSVDAVALSLQTSGNNGANNNPTNGQNGMQPQPNGIPQNQAAAMAPNQNSSMGPQQNGGNIQQSQSSGTDGDALQALHNVVTPASTPVPRCFSADNQQNGNSNQPQYYPRPPHVISPTSFMSYLKQPTVMITSINPHDPNADLHPGKFITTNINRFTIIYIISFCKIISP